MKQPYGETSVGVSYRKRTARSENSRWNLRSRRKESRGFGIEKRPHSARLYGRVGATGFHKFCSCGQSFPLKKSDFFWQVPIYLWSHSGILLCAPVNIKKQRRWIMNRRWADIFLIIELLAFYVGWKSEHTAQTTKYSESREYQHLLSLSQDSRRTRP